MADRQASLGEIRQVCHLKAMEEGGNLRREAACLHEVPVSIRRDRKPVRHAHAGAAQLAIQLTERGVLAADGRDLAQTDVLEPANE